jgi:hypothetical protein
MAALRISAALGTPAPRANQYHITTGAKKNRP